LKNNITQYKKKYSNKYKTICIAPLLSLRFTVSGNVQVCCFNRLYTIGKYPENSLTDIINSNTLKQIKSKIENDDLSFGCEYCYNLISNKLYDSVGAKNYNYLDNYSINAGFPVMMDFEIGNNCNLECVMCNGENSALIRQNREGKTPYKVPYTDNFVSELEYYIPHLKEARFVGGEPFMIDLNYKIWEKIIKINPTCKIIILTNGTILNDRIKELIEKGNFNISISADGINKLTYESIRINAKHEIFLNNFYYYLNYAKRNNYIMNFNFCPMSLNWKEIPEVFNFCNKEQLKVIIHTVYFPPHIALWSLETNKLLEILNFLKQNTPKTKIFNKIHKENNSAYYSLIKQLEKWISIAEKNNYNNLNDSELESLFFNKLQNYINNSKYFAINDKVDIYKTYSESFRNIFNKIDTIEKTKLYIFLNSFSIELLIAELINNDSNKIIDRLKYGIK